MPKGKGYKKGSKPTAAQIKARHGSKPSTLTLKERQGSKPSSPTKRPKCAAERRYRRAVHQEYPSSFSLPANPSMYGLDGPERRRFKADGASKKTSSMASSLWWGDSIPT